VIGNVPINNVIFPRRNRTRNKKTSDFTNRQEKNSFNHVLRNNNYIISQSPKPRDLISNTPASLSIKKFYHGINKSPNIQKYKIPNNNLINKDVHSSQVFKRNKSRSKSNTQDRFLQNLNLLEFKTTDNAKFSNYFSNRSSNIQ